eukprot:2109177-Amphidinium_carterae.1
MVCFGGMMGMSGGGLMVLVGPRQRLPLQMMGHVPPLAGMFWTLMASGAITMDFHVGYMETL